MRRENTVAQAEKIMYSVVVTFYNKCKKNQAV
jgi:hypothetical protein